MKIGVLILAAGVARAGDVTCSLSTPLGGKGKADSVRAVRILEDGSFLVGANVPAGTSLGGEVIRGNGDMIGVALRIRAGSMPEIETVHALPGPVKDMALDGSGRPCFAVGRAGLVRFTSDLNGFVHIEDVGPAERIDASQNGHVVVLGKEKLTLVSSRGEVVSRFSGHHRTKDLCIHGLSRTIIFVGFRNANAYDGTKTRPVQIAYARATDYEGKVKWTNYDWSTEREAEDFLNSPTNNMADTRGYRCTIGGDGHLYMAFEAAGGNHIFRFSPQDISERIDIVGGGAYHEFYNSAAEHKTVFGRYDPSTGNCLKIQQFCGRLSSGRANAVRVKEGEIWADGRGRTYLVGTFAYGIPLSFHPPGTGDYRGGGFLLVMSRNFSERLYCTRFQGGKAPAHTVHSRSTDGVLTIAFGGSGLVSEKPYYAVNPLQEGREEDGYVAVLRAKGWN